MNEFGGIFAISCVAVLAPLLIRLPAFAFMPVVGLELVLGVLIGPSVMGLVTNDNTIKFLAEFGLVFLFFQAGLESKRDEIGRAELRLGAFAWLASFALAVGFVGLLQLFGLVRSPLLIALILPTTAFGVLIPILRQSGELHSNFGRHVLGLAAIGELGPLLLASIVLAEEKHHLHQTFLSIAFFVVAFAAVIALLTLRSNGFSAKLARWLGQDDELMLLRISLLALLGFVFLADSFGMEAVVGAYAAGMAVAVFFSGCGGRALENRLTSIGSGFFIPLFFTASGVAFDLPSLVSSPANIGRLFLFTLAFLLIRIAPLGIYKNALAKSDLPALALLSSTTLPLVVAITYLGGQTGQMAPENASALVGAAIVTVTLFPMLANMVRAPSTGARSNAIVAAFANRIVAWSLGRVSNLLVLLPIEPAKEPRDEDNISK
jgi:Kef-type K+ transport system membrane component KefB